MARPSSDGRIDPHSLDLGTKRKPRHKARNRPEPPPELRQWEAGAEKRALARPLPPGVILEPKGMDREAWTSPHCDEGLWTLQLADAFGTRSMAVLTCFMKQLEALCGRDVWDEQANQWRLDEHEFSSCLALVNTVKPRNEMEAALAAQMVAVHLMQMKLSARALQYDGDIRTAATAGKLARTFTLQLESLQALRGKKRSVRQTITVKKELHQHVHYHDDRGAEIGNAQPRERIAAVDQRSTLRSQEQGGTVVPLSRNAGKGAL